MKTVAEIQQAIMELPSAQYTELVEWLYERVEGDWDEWDRQIEEDAAAGRLDFFKEKVEQAARDGTLGYL